MAIVERSQLNKGLNLLMDEQRSRGVDTESAVKLLEDRRQLLTLYWDFPIWSVIGQLFLDGRGKRLDDLDLTRTNGRYWLKQRAILFNPSVGDTEWQWYGLLRPLVKNQKITREAVWARFNLDFAYWPQLFIADGVDVQEVVEFHLNNPRHVLEELRAAVQNGLLRARWQFDSIKGVKDAFEMEDILLDIAGVPNEL